jgi:cytochrome c oxidase subunit II
MFWVMVALGTACSCWSWCCSPRRSGRPREVDRTTATTTATTRGDQRSRRLVIGGGVALPVVVLVPLAVVMLVSANRSPRLGDAYEIRVVGHQYWWEVEYPDADVTANEIHIPGGTPVRIVLETADVIHSFWVPELAGKIDMIPGQVTEVSSRPTSRARYLGQCAEFCGIQHARMRFLVIAPRSTTSRRGSREAAPAAPRRPTPRAGAPLFVEVGCAACHAVRGTTPTACSGPTSPTSPDADARCRHRANERGQLAGGSPTRRPSSPATSCRRHR